MDKFHELAPRIMRDLIKDLNLTPEQAAGIVGNLGHETGRFKHMQELNPVVAGSKGGWGWAQWTGPRRTAFMNWTNARKLDPSGYEANYGFLIHELTGLEKRALDALRKTKTVDEATVTFENTFERAGIKSYDSRKKLAREALGLYRPTAEVVVAGATVATGVGAKWLFPSLTWMDVTMITLFGVMVAIGIVSFIKYRKRDKNDSNDQKLV